MSKLPADVIRQVKAAIQKATTIEEIDRLESALHKKDVTLIQDLLQAVAPALNGLWVDKEKRKQPEPVEVIRSSETAPLISPSPSPSAKRPLTNKGLSTVALSLLFDRVKQDSSYQSSLSDSISSTQSGWRSSSEAGGSFGGLSSVAVECGTAVCQDEHGNFFSDVLIRFVCMDMESESTLIDEKIKIPAGLKPVDCRSDFTEVEESDKSLSEGVDLAEIQNRLIALLKGPETLIICHSAARSAHALKIKHNKWLPMSLLFKVNDKSRKSTDFHVRAHLPPYQLRQAVLGEPAANWASENVASVCLGSVRLTKIACAQFPRPQLEVEVPRSPESLWLQKIPRDFSVEGVRELFGESCGVDKIAWKFEPSEKDWLGECMAVFSGGQQSRDLVFEKLPTLSDIFVSWEVGDAVTEETLKTAGGHFGKVVGTRIPAKLAEGGRPFGFVSFLKHEEAVKMGEAKRIKVGPFTLLARPSQGTDRKSPFKRVPLAQKAIEVFKM